jgi:hypothetical protein
MEITVGNFAQKRIIKIEDDKSISFLKTNGALIKKWAIEEVFGIQYSPPTMLYDGSLAIAENYEDSTITAFLTITLMPNSVTISRDDKGKVAELLTWFESNRAPQSTDSPYLLEAKSGNSFLALEKSTIVLRSSGFLNAMAKGGIQGEKRIPIRSVLSVQFKKATDLTAGYIQFETAGGSQHAARGGVFEAAGDENSVVFSLQDMPQFEAFRKKVNELLESSPDQGQGQISTADELAKFAKLRDEGIISEEEFVAKKKSLLGL